MFRAKKGIDNMTKTTDIRNKEITIKFKDIEECNLDAVKRYMKRKGFTYYEQERKAGLIFQGWYNDEYSSLWIASENVIQNGEKLQFTLTGDR